MENSKMTFDSAKWQALKAEAKAVKEQLLASVNQVVTEKLVDLVYVDRIPDSAQFGFTCSTGYTVYFTRKDTWIETETKLYKGKK